MFSITAKRFWTLFTLGGALIFIGGLVATILLIIETGERVPDSQCSSMHASVLAACYTSDDPAVLIGVAPLLGGIGMAIFGGIKWAAAANFERATADSDTPVSPPPGVDPPDNPLEELEALRANAKREAPPPP